jgi:hypothetical protein
MSSTSTMGFPRTDKLKDCPVAESLVINSKRVEVPGKSKGMILSGLARVVV